MVGGWWYLDSGCDYISPSFFRRFMREHSITLPTTLTGIADLHDLQANLVEVDIDTSDIRYMAKWDKNLLY
jgi:hypothetical protein